MNREEECPGCRYYHPMEYCAQCGTWMNCKIEGIDADYVRRPEEDKDDTVRVVQTTGSRRG
jgi:hypothetical protein